jgi:threonine synthase
LIHFYKRVVINLLIIMKYQSTRGGEKGLSFRDVLFSGYAKDGGLYFPESIPTMTKQELEQLATCSYTQMVKTILRLFIDEAEIPTTDLDELVDAAFQKFVDPADPIKLAKLQDSAVIAELFHGPTLAFKDLALGVVGQMYDYFLSREKRHTTVLIGTSGDTGSAAISALRGLKSVDVVVLLPKGRCTQIQELQMTTVLDENVHNFAVEGTSDDLDVPIKAVFADIEYVKTHSLCSINSINWARILVQISHYFYCYFQMAETVGDTVEIIVPTGACGNIASGYVAYEMGLPIQMVAAVNTNDIVRRTFTTGDFSLSENVLQTWASAMDIQVPYNVERMILMASGLNTDRVRDMMAVFESERQTKIPDGILQIMRKVVVDSQAFDDDAMIETMRRCYRDNHYILCPHTAVGMAYFYANTNNNIPQIVLATAAPDKFPEAVELADINPTHNPEIQKLLTKETRFDWMRLGESWEQILRTRIEKITAAQREGV